MSNPFRKTRREKRRNKPYRRRAVHTPMLVATDLVLRPLEAIVDRLEIDGTVDVDGKGNPVFQAGDGNWYDAAGAIEGVMWHFDMMATRHGRTLPLDGLKELVIAFRYCVPVQASTMQKLRAALPVLRKTMSLAAPDEQVDLLRQTQIKAEMEHAQCGV
ncbi:hypothetical protein [Bordetella petrii]|uniref:hypothetical protein n=1 Tax=Bordetella petrii TaxID=94624 RepID=UPI0004793C12|nr:hypothetical protein [Bordetella petrii]